MTPINHDHPGPSTYEDARRELFAAWARMRTCPDAPEDQRVALDGLRLVLPLAAQNKLVHNYRYREVTAVALHNERRAQAGRSVHGPDGVVGAPIEIKSAKVTGKTITPTQIMGMFDKVHARSDPAATLTPAMMDELRAAVRAAREHPVAIHGVLINSPRRRRLLENLLPSEDANYHWPPMISRERLTSSASGEAVDFCLFVGGGVDPLLTIETTTAALECHLGDHFDAGVRHYFAGMTNRQRRAPSARDSVAVSLGNIMSMHDAAALVQLDAAQLLQYGLEMDAAVTTWAQKGHHATDGVRAQIDRWNSGRIERQDARSQRYCRRS